MEAKSVSVSAKGIMGRIDNMEKDTAVTMDEKIIFLNDSNLEVLKGYKASVEWKTDWTAFFRKHEIHVVITGFSESSAKGLFKELTAMRPEEIKGR